MNSDIDNFSKVIDSLKKYRRAEIKNDNGSNLASELYVDLLPKDHIIKTCLKEHTTFLIGRKGTGKSTIFLKLESELKKQKRIFPCYIDVKTVYDRCKPTNNYIELADNQYVDIYKRYLWESEFIREMLNNISVKIDEGFIKENFFQRFKLQKSQKDKIQKEIDKIKNSLFKTDSFSQIEFPTFEAHIKNQRIKKENNSKTNREASLKVSSVGASGGINLGEDLSNSFSIEEEESISLLLLEHFDIQSFIEKIKNILTIANFDTLYVLLDDFSEIDDSSIKFFTDIIIAPLNNRSEEFIKFKIASYPSRTYFGAIDPTKIDQVDLDFFKLYASHQKNKMEALAIDFTQRLLQKRSQLFLKNSHIDDFFEISRTLDMKDYYKLLFQVSSNVPRILGYILAHCYESHVIYNKKITKAAITNAAQKYYDNTLVNFFKETTHSTSSIDEKVSILQLQNLLNLLVDRSKDIKRRIVNGELHGANYNKSFPASSHFHVNPNVEEFLQTLELNFFISKYIEYSNRDGKGVSVYSLNYGLCEKYDLIYGVPSDGKANERKYLIERPFDYNNLIMDYLSSLQKIECDTCSQIYSDEDLVHLKYYEYRCKDRKCDGIVQIKKVNDKFLKSIDRIHSNVFLSKEELKIIMALQEYPEVSAKDLAELIDIGSSSIGQRAIKLDEDYGLVIREKKSRNYFYSLTAKGEEYMRNVREVDIT